MHGTAPAPSLNGPLCPFYCAATSPKVSSIYTGLELVVLGPRVGEQQLEDLDALGGGMSC